MKSIEFCYFLKGAIEVNQSNYFGINATQTIKDKLENVLEVENEPHPFCDFLNGYFSLSKPEILNEEVVNIIKERLDNICKEQIPISSQVKTTKRDNGNSNSRENRAMC
jgi:hypothetical protein